MNYESILNLFLLYANIPEELSLKYSDFCVNAVYQLRKELRSETLESDNGGRLNTAAAALAFYKFSLTLSSVDDAQYFKAGDITIHKDTSKRLECAKTLWENEREMIADLLKDKSFIFKSV